MAVHHLLLARQFHLGTKETWHFLPASQLIWITIHTPIPQSAALRTAPEAQIPWIQQLNIIQALTFFKMHKIQHQLKLLSIQAVLVETKKKKALRTLLIKYEMGLPWQSINKDSDNTVAVSPACTFHCRYTWNRENNSQVTISCIIFSALLKFAFYKGHFPSVLKIYCFRKHSQ